jgi:hypothetical protein
MPITLIIASLIVTLNTTVTWAKVMSKSPSPVAFETVQTPAQAFWIANEYGALALTPKPNRKQKIAIFLDRTFQN